ncbi:MAG: hydroxyacid dehydrogenase, partial [candidate division Zixibacteria bacterium]|nr:hydroxyacid dehydrogenase [candidate division Zixibacteria bacterium]
MLNVHIQDDPAETYVKGLQSWRLPGITFTCGTTVPDPAEYEILISGVPERTFLDAAPRLRALIIPWAGLPAATRDLLLEYPHVSVHNIHHNAGPTAEMAMALMLSAAKQVLPIDRHFRSGDWTPRYTSSSVPLLDGRTCLILGYGEIGQRIAQAARGLGMEIAAVSRTGKNRGAQPVRLHPMEKLHILLPPAQVLFVSV